MRNKTMFSLDITQSDEFVFMQKSAQALYLHLTMSADDDGYCQYRKVLRVFNGNDSDLSDLNILRENNFVFVFNKMLLFLVHFQDANNIRKDLYKESAFKKEFPYKNNSQKTNKKQQVIKSRNETVTDTLQERNDDVTKSLHRVVKSSVVKSSIENIKEKEKTPALSKLVLSLFNEIFEKKVDVKNFAHTKLTDSIINQLKKEGIKTNEELLEKFKFVFTNRKKKFDDEVFGVRDDPNTILAKINFFKYLTEEPYQKPAVAKNATAEIEKPKSEVELFTEMLPNTILNEKNQAFTPNLFVKYFKEASPKRQLQMRGYLPLELQGKIPIQLIKKDIDKVNELLKGNS